MAASAELQHFTAACAQLQDPAGRPAAEAVLLRFRKSARSLQLLQQVLAAALGLVNQHASGAQ